MASIFEALMPSTGRPRQLGAHTVLLAMAFAIDEGRPAHLVAGWRTLWDLPGATRLRLGAAVTRTGTLEQVTYRQFSHAHRTILGAIDPAPVPSFRGVTEDDRAAHLVAARRGVDTETATERLRRVLDQLVEASVPERYKNLSRALRCAPSCTTSGSCSHTKTARRTRRAEPRPALLRSPAGGADIGATPSPLAATARRTRHPDSSGALCASERQLEGRLAG